MNGLSRGNRWVIVLFVAFVAVVVGVTAYNAGVSRGLAMNAVAAAGSQGAAPLMVYPYGWYRPWGFGFGFFGPFLFFALWFLLLRGLFWGRWRRRWTYDGVPARFEEWHRRAHEQMNAGSPPAKA
jgi:hypothetical protein